MYKAIIDDFKQGIDALMDFTTLLGNFLQDQDKKAREISLLAHKYNQLFVVRERHRPLSDSNKKAIDITMLGIEKKVSELCGKAVYFHKSRVRLPIKLPKDLPMVVTIMQYNPYKKMPLSESEIEVYQRHRGTVYTSTFINLITLFEYNITRLLQAHYTYYPKAACLDDKTVSYKELSGFKSVNEAKQHLLDKKIDDIMREGYDKWMIKLQEPTTITKHYQEKNKFKIVEIFERRNSLVHKMGVADSRYLRKVDCSLRHGVEIGSILNINERYLLDSISFLYETFVLTATELWLKRNKAKGLVINFINTQIDFFGWGNSSDAAETMCLLIENVSEVSGKEKRSAQLKRLWYTRDNRNSKEYKEELERIDIKRTNQNDRLFLLAVQEDFDGIARFIEQKVKQGSFKGDVIHKFFMFDFTQSDQFNDLCVRGVI